MSNTSDNQSTQSNSQAIVILCIILITVLLLIAGSFLFMMLILSDDAEVYETNDVGKYGEYIGNHVDDYPQSFISSFFPRCLEPYFEDVQYQYKALPIGPYACEVYLEFTISDEELYQSFFEEATRGMSGQPFPFDNNFVSYNVVDKLVVNPQVHKRSPDGKEFYYFQDDAEMGKILFCHEQQRVIYCAIVISYDGGYATDCFDAFYTRFGIDPLAYSDYVKSVSEN